MLNLIVFSFYFYILPKVNSKMKTLAKAYTENTEILNKLANRTEDFAVQLIDQLKPREELVIYDKPEHVDRYASMLSDVTDDAIIHSQKKVSAIKNRRGIFWMLARMCKIRLLRISMHNDCGTSIFFFFLALKYNTFCLVLRLKCHDLNFILAL